MATAHAGGLTQRHRGAAATAQATADDGQAASDEDSYQDDKQTRLTLMEEVLLLGLKDREVCNLFVSL